MEGYDARTYGDAFADVYDDWYANVSDVDSTVATLLDLADGGSVLELGVGTGRLAVPLATAGMATGVRVTGIDTSAAMLDRLAHRDGDGLVETFTGDMAADLPTGPFDLVFVAYNTLFNLTGDGDQERCLAGVAAALAPGGHFVVEAYVPDDTDDPSGADVSLRSMTADRVVLSVSRRDAGAQVAEGQFVEFTEQGGVRLRPWSIRYRSPEQLDAMAAAAGLHLVERWASFARDTFDDTAERHVSVYRRT